MIHWLNRLSPPRVAVAAIAARPLQALVAFVRSRGYRVEVVDLTTDLEVPVFLAAGVRADGRGPALLVGAGADLEASVALERALGELYSAVLAQNEPWVPPPAVPRDGVTCLQDHADYHARPENLQSSAFLWSAAPPLASPAGERAVGERAVGERAVGERAGGEWAGGERAGSERAGGERAGGERAGGATPAARHPLARLVERLAAAGYPVIGVDLSAPGASIRC